MEPLGLVVSIRVQNINTVEYIVSQKTNQKHIAFELNECVDFVTFTL